MPDAYLLGREEDFEEAWSAFCLMEATDWRFLPYAGGLMDQPELLMRNVFRINNLTRKTREVTRRGAHAAE